MVAASRIMLAQGPPVITAKVLVSHTSQASADGSNLTTSSIDTTGANLLVVHTGCYNNTLTVVADNKSNVWFPLTVHAFAFGATSQLWYAKNAIVGTGHTFSIVGGGSPNNPNLTYPALCVSSFSGAYFAPFDVENGGSAGSGSPPQSVGSITPNFNNALIIAGICEFDTFVGSFSINASLTILDTRLYNSGTNLGSTIAYFSQPTIAAINPAWNWTSGGNSRAYSIAAFK